MVSPVAYSAIAGGFGARSLGLILANVAALAGRDLAFASSIKR